MLSNDIDWMTKYLSIGRYCISLRTFQTSVTKVWFLVRYKKIIYETTLECNKSELSRALHHVAMWSYHQPSKTQTWFPEYTFLWTCWEKRAPLSFNFVATAERGTRSCSTRDWCAASRVGLDPAPHKKLGLRRRVRKACQSNAYLDQFCALDAVGHVEADVHLDLCCFVRQLHNWNLSKQNKNINCCNVNQRHTNSGQATTPRWIKCSMHLTIYVRTAQYNMYTAKGKKLQTRIGLLSSALHNEWEFVLMQLPALNQWSMEMSWCEMTSEISHSCLSLMLFEDNPRDQVSWKRNAPLSLFHFCLWIRLSEVDLLVYFWFQDKIVWNNFAHQKQTYLTSTDCLSIFDFRTRLWNISGNQKQACLTSAAWFWHGKVCNEQKLNKFLQETRRICRTRA